MEEIEQSLVEQGKAILAEDTASMNVWQREDWVERAEQLLVKLLLLEFIESRTENLE